MDAGKSRRRGPELDEAILDAAWAEMTDCGYAGLTLESVARRAGTSRPVLHRRWPSRMQLAAGALARYIALNPVEIPDLGSVSAELSLLLRELSSRARPDVLRLLFDIGTDLADARSNLANLRAEVANDRLLRDVLERGVARGEIDPDRLTPRMVALPTDLVRHEMLMTLAPLTDDAIREIVEEIFLPLVRRHPEGG